jgi:hypothetical protein
MIGRKSEASGEIASENCVMKTPFKKTQCGDITTSFTILLTYLQQFYLHRQIPTQTYSEEEGKYNNSPTTLHEISTNDVHVEFSTQQQDRNSTVSLQIEAPPCRLHGLPNIGSYPIIPLSILLYRTYLARSCSSVTNTHYRLILTTC